MANEGRYSDLFKPPTPTTVEELYDRVVEVMGIPTTKQFRTYVNGVLGPYNIDLPGKEWAPSDDPPLQDVMKTIEEAVRKEAELLYPNLDWEQSWGHREERN